MYDYLRRRVFLGQGSQQYYLHNVDIDNWQPIDFVPEPFLENRRLAPDQVMVSLGLVTGLDPVGDAAAPDLDSLIESREILRG
jgi:hypothetical protein